MPIFHYFPFFSVTFWPDPFSIFSYFIFLFLNFLSLFVFTFCEMARTCRFSVIFAKVQWHPWMFVCPSWYGCGDTALHTSVFWVQVFKHYCTCMALTVRVHGRSEQLLVVKDINFEHSVAYLKAKISERAQNYHLYTTALQGCLQERHESTWHQHWFLGGPCSWPHDVEKHPEPTPQDRGKEAGECRSRKKGPQKGAQQL